MVNQIIKSFVLQYGNEPEVIVRAPGRINLIGEHTDYNNGFVLPAAINRNIFLGFSKRGDNEVHLHSMDLKESYSFKIDEIAAPCKTWSDYITGVVQQLLKRNFKLEGFNCVFGGNIPIGAGLSSSAALECGIAFGLNKLFNHSLSALEIALTGQATENEFVGVRCGIMDPFASVFGKASHLIKLDCQNLSYEYLPFAAGDYEIVLVDSGVKHSLAYTEYNVRRRECEQGLAVLRSLFQGVKSLRDVTLHQLESATDKMPPVVFKRCMYVVGEIERVILACEDLRKNDIISFGKKMFATHEGLRYGYDVSCVELDFLVDEARKHSLVAGARMMGGGFGGCTINLVHKMYCDDFIADIRKVYACTFKNTPESYIVELTDGISLLLPTDDAGTSV